MKITLAANECVDHNQQEREVRHRKESTPMDHSDLVLLIYFHLDTTAFYYLL
jgi:hypothetical protein